VPASKMVKGNTAVVIGALYAGCESFFGYPITPASEIAHDAAEYFPKLGRVFLQAESETSAINMLYGAAGAGRRAMTASSGPGISLMQEGFSYLAGAELPAVVVDIMRAGPGLGNIGPEQSDYNQIVKGGGHGNYYNIVLAPASVQEMCDFTYHAFDLAFKWRNPVVVLADAVLGQMMEPLVFPESSVTPETDLPWAAGGTPTGRSNVITSIVLDFDELEEHNRKLLGKYQAIQEDGAWTEGHCLEDAELVIVAYGACSRIARTVVDICRAQGMPVGLLRLQTLFPFPGPELQALADQNRNFLVMELSDGQLYQDVQLAIACKRPVDLLTRYGGNLITVEEGVERVAELLRKS
jgi:2-oxoisovalerate ferredoxin oxidoreductase alpha subunit